VPAVARKKLSVGFDGGMLSSDAGVLLLRGIERRLGLSERLAACMQCGDTNYNARTLVLHKNGITARFTGDRTGVGNSTMDMSKTV
jgi:hypothetical protein